MSIASTNTRAIDRHKKVSAGVSSSEGGDPCRDFKAILIPSYLGIKCIEIDVRWYQFSLKHEADLAH